MVIYGLYVLVFFPVTILNMESSFDVNTAHDT